MYGIQLPKEVRYTFECAVHHPELAFTQTSYVFVHGEDDSFFVGTWDHKTIPRRVLPQSPVTSKASRVWVRAAVTFDYCSLRIGGFSLCLTGSNRLCSATLRYKAAWTSSLCVPGIETEIFVQLMGFHSNSFYWEYLLTGIRSTGISFQWEFAPVGVRSNGISFQWA